MTIPIAGHVTLNWPRLHYNKTHVTWACFGIARYAKRIGSWSANSIAAGSSQLYNSSTTRLRTITYFLPFTPCYKPITSWCCKSNFENRIICLFMKGMTGSQNSLE